MLPKWPNEKIADSWVSTEYSRDIAKTSVADEAGAMTIPQALLGWPFFRLLILAGDQKQLQPPVMTQNQKNLARIFVNSFAPQAGVSILQWMNEMGWPTLTMSEQLRMANGGFDTAQSVFYADVHRFSYADRCHLRFHPRAQEFELWMKEYPGVESRLEEGKVLPVFVHSDGICEVKEGTMSRYNTKQAHTAIDLIQELLERVQVDASEISIVTPYSGMNSVVRTLLAQRKDRALKKVQVNTTDTFQGRQTSFVVCILTVSERHRLGHVASPQRLNVAITRHTDGLIVVGNINSCGREQEGYDALLRWFKTNGRVVHLPATTTGGAGAWW